MLYNNITTHHRRKQSNGKVVIVDYDDTILPSTFVDRWQIENSKDLPQHVSCKNAKLTTFILKELLIYSAKHESCCLRTITTFFIWILSHRQFNFSFFVRASSSYYPVSKHARRTKSSNRKISRRSIKIWRGEFIYFILLCIFVCLEFRLLFLWKSVHPPHCMVVDGTRKPKLIC